jgi:hypothetical protein
MGDNYLIMTMSDNDNDLTMGENDLTMTWVTMPMSNNDNE